MSDTVFRVYLANIRRVCQALFTLFCLFAGWRFYHFHQWAIGKSDMYVPRPPSVEAFLPISALMGLKRLILTGNYDPTHPAGLTILIAAIIIAFLFRKGFCGWICPIGFTSNLAEKAGKRLKVLIKPFPFIDYPLLSLKYILLGFFIYFIVIRMDMRAIESFLNSPYNFIADSKMLYFFISPSKLSLIILTSLLLLSFVFKNFWCRFLCPYGALLGVLSLISPIAVRRKIDTCIDCKKCDQVCPGQIMVSQKSSVRSSECIGCLECVGECPKEDCLTVAAFHKRIPALVLPGLILTTFFTFYFTALLTGHWHNNMPPEKLKGYYQIGEKIKH